MDDLKKSTLIPILQENIAREAYVMTDEARQYQVIYTGTPELMGEYAKLAMDAGAKIIGGCCGTSAHHLAAMRTAIDAHTKGARPNLETVVDATGELVNKIAAPQADNERGGRRRSRRR